MSAPHDLPDRATVRVCVWDVTSADAAATRVMARTVHPDGGTVSRVVLPWLPSAEGRRYVVSVHVDVDGDGEVASGDWVSTSAHPVPTPGGEVLVALTRV